MLLPLVISLTLSLVAPVAVLAFGDDLNDSWADYRAEQDRAHERQMQEWRAEEQAAQYRNEQAVRERNQPTEYQNSRDYNSTEHFSLWNGTDQKACTATKYDVSCW